MSIQNGYKGIDVNIISYTKHPGKILWDMLKQTWIELQDIEYKKFSEKLIPTIQPERVIGIRTPVLKKYAKELQ